MGLKSWVFTLAILASAQTAPARGKRIQEARYLTVGGLEQWVTIRGDDDRKPVLLFVHGGPGDAQSALVTTYAPYEHDFVLVQWDQRGAGRTFARNRTAPISLEGQITDGLDLAGQLHARFPKQDLIVLGHSWGSVIATAMVQRRPEIFAAFVGTGQVASWADKVQFQFDYLKDVARKANDVEWLQSLEQIGTPDPTNAPQYFRFLRPLRQHMNAPDTAWLTGLKELLTASGETDADLAALGEGMGASGEALIESSIRTDLPATATRFALPYYVIQGRHDLYTPTSLAERYFAMVTAPRKRMVVLENAGHFAPATHPREFVAALKQVLASVRWP